MPYETKTTSRWSGTGSFPKVAECSSLGEVEANINMMVQLKERLEAPGMRAGSHRSQVLSPKPL